MSDETKAPGAADVADDAAYGADQIQVLEGLEAVRKRPGMYIGSTGPAGLHHMVYEVVDNSVDEAMAGYCDHIDGDPAGRRRLRGRRQRPRHPRRQDDRSEYPALSAAEVVLTVLHAGGKFGGGGYKVSGGLHGVGISVVNALSTQGRGRDRPRRRAATSCRSSTAATSRTTCTQAGPAARGGRTGTTVRFWPDPTIFDEITFRAQTLTERLQMMAFLNAGLEIDFRDQREGHEHRGQYRYDGGIRDFVRHVNASKESLFCDVGYFQQAEENDSGSMEVEIAFQWNTGFNADGLHSFANGISTIEGGMHEEGFKKSLTNTMNKYARDKGVLKEKDANLQGEDIREGLTAIISVKLVRPAVRGPDQGQARQRPHAVAGRAGHQREAGRLARGAPVGGQAHRAPRRCRRPGPARRPAAPATPPGGSRRSTAPACPASWPTARRTSPASPSSTSSRATRPAVRPRTPATRAPWRSCPSAARS